MIEDGKNLVLDVLYDPSECKLLPEADKTGNIEYKLRLDKKDIEKRDNMVSQMLWRMNNGRNETGQYVAHYILGVNDDGTFSDMTESALTNTMNIFRGIAKRANAKVVSDKFYVFPGNKMIIHAIVKKNQQERDVPEAKVVIMGPTYAGKSSLMGRLTYGQKDDGNGFSRKLVLRHAHEKSSGATSCPKYDTIGFAGSNIMNYSIGLEFNMENIYNSSDRMINLIDIPGDMKYIKTILYSVSSIAPDHVIVCIPLKRLDDLIDQDYYDDPEKDKRVTSPTTPKKQESPKKPSHQKRSSSKKTPYTEQKVTDPSEDELIPLRDVVEMYSDVYRFIVSFCLANKIQPVFVYTKSDLSPNHVDIQECRKTVGDVFNRWRDELLGSTFHKKEDDIAIKKSSELSMEMFGTTDAYESTDILSDNLSDISDLPIDAEKSSEIDFSKCVSVAVSNVTDAGYDTLINLLGKISIGKKSAASKDKLFVVNDSFTIPDTGQILHGILRYGVINVDDTVNVLCHGVTYKKKVKTIQRKTLDVEKLVAGESGSITFYGKIDKGIDKTSMIVGNAWTKLIVTKAKVVSVFDTVKLKPQQYMMFVDNNIVTVLLSHNQYDDTDGDVMDLTCVNSFNFVLDTELGVLKDEQHNYFFIRFLN